MIFGTPGTIEAYATTSLGEFFAEAQAVYSLNPQQDTPSSDPDCDHLLSTWESETRRLLRLHDQAPAAWDLITQQRTRDVRPVHTDEEIDAWRDYHQQIHR
ncbi:MAG: hypothetical protein H6697_05905 [Myxococcales bacterium]|nr:hypothetical protein [Myxococcales bacterium]